ncbi:HvfX family Cu-binding RiPP maturation protein [Alteromonas sp. ASW11-130]|uniref:HvfX family Cu-binding RiPP maturation protein n=1 Tax=Alteromonas sp. ASW11-130 TaxID=3015775 RepID=UPI00224205BE|nr:DoxX family protein [Alteromonas sp. ASW11-130]MCW8092063.1 DoxX family protein [Alteromonas sp. ASW11-130]
MLRGAYIKFKKLLNYFNGVPLLLVRLYLAPVLIQAGWTKVIGFSDTVAWFGNSEWGLGLPLPEILVILTICAELIGGVMILLGLFTRLVSIPLCFTMLVAMITVHAENGWLAIADKSSWLADGTLYYDNAIMTSGDKLAMANSILQEYGHYEWLTQSGKFVILNNGIEFAATYFILLLVLLFYGGGKYLSIDYLLSRQKIQ